MERREDTRLRTQGDAIKSSSQREIRYLTAEEVIRLRRYTETRAFQAKKSGAVTDVRAWALLGTILSSDLRASEIASLLVGACLLGYGEASLVVRQDMGDKQHEVVSSPKN